MEETSAHTPKNINLLATGGLLQWQHKGPGDALAKKTFIENRTVNKNY
jgi:hypothetical protein